MSLMPLPAQEMDTLPDRIRNGDPTAETEFVQLFGRRVFVMALARTRDREASQDLVQEILMAALSALRNGCLREQEKLAAFVHGTARNLINNYLRGNWQKPQEIPITPDLAAATSGDHLESAERLALVCSALSAINARDRRILLMTLVDGLKPGAIAQELGITPELVRAYKSRALKKLTERVNKKMSRR